MIENTADFLNNVRNIYLHLDKNYTPFLEMSALQNKEVDLDRFFEPDLRDEYLKNTKILKDKLDDTKCNEDLKFSDQFNFKISDQQKAFGSRLVIEEMVQTIAKKKAKNGFVNTISLGIGDGKTTLQYAKTLDLNNVDVLTGLDLHKDYLNEAGKNLPELNPIVFDLNTLSPESKLPFENQSADIAECTMVAHHVEKFELLVAEVVRVLKKGGTFVYLDLIDKTNIENNMEFPDNHEYPPYHGVEFFRDHKTVKSIIGSNMAISRYVRVGPGIVFLTAIKE